MKILLVLLSIISFNFMPAQPGGGGQGGGGQSQGGGMQQGGEQRQRPETREFNASEVAGIFNYDDEEAVKKIKIKKKQKDLSISVRRAIINYNNKINEIGLLNKDNFDTLNVFVNAMMKERSGSRGQGQRGQGNQQSGQNDEMGGDDDRRGRTNDDAKGDRKQIKELIEQKINPARIGVRKAEKKLNQELESLLSEKQYKKWIKYQEQVKDDLNPKEETQQNNNRGGGMQGGGMQGGSGRSGFGGGGGGMR